MNGILAVVPERGTFENRHSGAREPGIHSHNTIILACLYDEATGVMDSGLLASLGPGMTRSYANVPAFAGTTYNGSVC